MRFSLLLMMISGVFAFFVGAIMLISGDVAGSVPLAFGAFDFGYFLVEVINDDLD